MRPASDRADGCSGRRTGGIRAVNTILFLCQSALSSWDYQSSAMGGAGFREGTTRYFLSTCVMIFWNVGAAAAEVFIVAGSPKVATTTYSGLSAGAMPAMETTRSR